MPGSIPEAASAAYAAAQRDWPGVRVAEEVFAAWLAERAAPGDPLRTSELYLACACAHGDPAALRAIERSYFGGVDAALARLGASAEQKHELRQELRRKLFVGEDGALGAIAAFGGKGELGRWLRAVGVRSFLNLERRHGRERPASDERLFEQLAAPGDDPELAHLKQRYRRELGEAFTAALAQLADRERALLRYHVVDGLSIDEIGAIYRVHRTTAFRWIEAAKLRLAARTHAQLERRIGLTGAQLASVVRLVQSQLDVSVRQLLG